MTDFTIRDAQRLSHAYIVTAASLEESRRAALRIAAAAVCQGRGDLPCGVCRACRKVKDGIHPDVITVRRSVDEKGKQKREINVDQVRQMGVDAYVLPNEADRKVYVIEDADRMNLPAQNAALKLLEEPPKGVLFLLCVTNSQLLLSTVRSRCAEFICNGGADQEDPGSRALAEGFVKVVASCDSAALLRWCMKNEGLDNRGATAFFESAERLLTDMLCGRSPALGLSRRSLTRLVELVQVCLRRLKVNTAVKQLFGLLAVDAIDSSGNRGSSID